MNEPFDLQDCLNAMHMYATQAATPSSCRGPGDWDTWTCKAEIAGKLADVIERLDADAARERAEKESLKLEVARLTTELAEAEGELEKMGQAANEAEEYSDLLKTELASYEGPRIPELLKENTEFTHRIVALEAERDRLKARNALLHERRGKLVIERDKLRAALNDAMAYTLHGLEDSMPTLRKQLNQIVRICSAALAGTSSPASLPPAAQT